MMDANKIWPGMRLKARVFISKANTTLRHPNFYSQAQDIPVGTLFRVGGFNLVEKWADLEAEHLYPMRRRFTYEELGRLFEFAE